VNEFIPRKMGIGGSKALLPMMVRLLKTRGVCVSVLSGSFWNRGTERHDGLEKQRKRSDPQVSPSVEGSIDDEFFYDLRECGHPNDLVARTLIMPIATRLEHRVSFPVAYNGSRRWNHGADRSAATLMTVSSLAVDQ
jgi:hypothetical protein